MLLMLGDLSLRRTGTNGCEDSVVIRLISNLMIMMIVLIIMTTMMNDDNHDDHGDVIMA